VHEAVLFWLEHSLVQERFSTKCSQLKKFDVPGIFLHTCEQAVRGDSIFEAATGREELILGNLALSSL
jgi:hypothetical protein